jgi:NDP-4-keto-2,6-dideoxyhexose 3-C-methyltransferase
MVAKRESRHAESPEVAVILDQEARAGLNTLQPFHDFAKNVAASRATLRAFLDEAKSFGKTVCALGASTKGNVLLQYCQITEADVARVGEVNPDKFEAFTPGTLLPIVSEEDVLAMQPDYLLVLPWHFRSFFVEHPRYFGHNLIFPLPQLELIRTTEPAPSERPQAPRARTEEARL